MLLDLEYEISTNRSGYNSTIISVEKLSIHRNGFKNKRSGDRDKRKTNKQDEKLSPRVIRSLSEKPKSILHFAAGERKLFFSLSPFQSPLYFPSEEHRQSSSRRDQGGPLHRIMSQFPGEGRVEAAVSFHPAGTGCRRAVN